MINQDNYFYFYIAEILVGKTDKYLHTFKRYTNGSVKTVDNLSTVFTNQFTNYL